MKTELDWSAYDSYGAGDAYAQIPAQGGAFGKAAAVCIGNRQCQRDEKGELALFPQLRAACADTRVIANGTSCRHQIRDGVARESQHLAQVLQLALAEPYQLNGETT